MKTQNELIQHYQNFDFSKAKVVEPSLIKKIRQLQQEETQQPLDEDVFNWVIQQDDSTKRHINAVIRHFMAVKMA